MIERIKKNESIREGEKKEREREREKEGEKRDIDNGQRWILQYMHKNL